MGPMVSELDALRLQAQQDPSAQNREALAQGLVQAVLAAREEAHVPAINALLQELRGLAASRGEQSLHEALGCALFQAVCTHLYVGEAEDAQHCLRELRCLFQQHGGAVLLVEFAGGVFEMVSDRSLADDHMGVDELLGELHDLSRQYDTPQVHKAFASALFNTQYDHFARGATQPALMCLAGLRTLALRCGTAEVRALQARGLYNAIQFYSLAGEMGIVVSYIKELETLGATHNDPVVRAALGSALYSMNNDALQNKNPLGTRYCLQELRQLLCQHDEAALRLSLASTLLATYNAYSIAGDALGMEQLLQELRALANKYAEPGILEEFAKMLCNGLCATLEVEKNNAQAQHDRAHGMAEGMPPKTLTGHQGPHAAETLLGELAALCHQHNDVQVATQYAHGLTAATAGPCMQGHVVAATNLLQELRLLAGRFSTPVVQRILAEGLVNMQACHLARQGNGRVVAGTAMLPRAEESVQVTQAFAAGAVGQACSPAEQDHSFFLLLEELRGLAQANQTPPVQEELVKGLVNSLAYLPAAGGSFPSRQELLEELRALVSSALPQVWQGLLGQGLYNAARKARMEGAVREALALLQEAQTILEPLRRQEPELMDVYANIVEEVVAIEGVYGVLPQNTMLQ